MGYFSARPDGGPFRLFDTAHVRAVVATGLGVAGTIALGRRLEPTGRRRTKNMLVASLWAQELAFHLWHARHRTWSIQGMLPLHVCSTLVWVGGINLLRPTRVGDDLTWYWGMGGVPQALLTPDLAEFGEGHFRFHQFFTSHGFLITCALWPVLVEGRRPTAAGGARAFAMMAAQATVAHLVNRRLGSNYMFVSRKPDTPTALDRMPPWPGYIPVVAALATVAFSSVYAPFAIADAVRARRPTRRV